MEQKNTIVKCNSTTCFYNYKGICNQSVIDLDMYGQCNDYVECEKTEEPAELKSDLFHFDEEYEELFSKTRGSRAQGNFIEDAELDKELRERFKIFIKKWCDEHPSLSQEEQKIMNDIGYVPPLEEIK